MNALNHYHCSGCSRLWSSYGEAWDLDDCPDCTAIDQRPDTYDREERRDLHEHD